MTEHEFWTKLSRTKGWRLIKSEFGLNQIRQKIGEAHSCPIMTVQGKCRLNWWSNIIVSYEFTKAIADAADERPGYNPDLRRRLLSVCGLDD